MYGKMEGLFKKASFHLETRQERQFKQMGEQYLNKFIYNKDKYYLLIYYFQYMLGGNFIKKLITMSEDISATNGHIGYMFASGCDEEDIENGDYFENGVMFFFGNDDFDEIIVDYSIYYNSLKLACGIYLEENPKDYKIVNEKLEIIRMRYNL